MDSLGSTSSTSLTPLLQPWFHVELTPRAFANPYAKSSRYARESSVSAAAGLLPVSENLVDVDDMNFKFSDRFFEVPALRGVNVVQIAACARSSFVRTDASRVLGWGANDYGYVMSYPPNKCPLFLHHGSVQQCSKCARAHESC